MMTTSAGSHCPFCQPARERIIFENPLVIAIWDAFPVNQVHALVVPRRHVPTWFEASAESQGQLEELLEDSKRLYDRFAEVRRVTVQHVGIGRVRQGAGWLLVYAGFEELAEHVRG